ncbi:hypothetical protein [Rhodoflexus sp.]
MLATLCQLIYSLIGWKAFNNSQRRANYLPPVTKLLMIIAPHTSNRDLVAARLLKSYYRKNIALHPQHYAG